MRFTGSSLARVREAYLTLARSCIKKAPTTPASSASSSQFRLRLDQKPSALPSEIWLLLSRHQRTKADPDEFLGVSVARSWGTEMGLVDTTRVDGTASLALLSRMGSG